VHHFNDRRHGHRRLARFAEQLTGEQHEGGPQAFSAALLQMAVDGGDGVDRGDGFEAHLLFNAPQIRFDKLENLAGC
jgi:hypothetical protein